MTEQPVIIGMNNPLSVRPEHALFPDPPGCTGWRIWQLLVKKVPWATEDLYLEAFDRRNACDRRVWDKGRASELLAEALPRLEGRTVILLGLEVQRAAGLPRLPNVIPIRERGIVFRCLPHPSGRCRWYNDPVNREMASLVLEELYLRSPVGQTELKRRTDESSTGT